MSESRLRETARPQFVAREVGPATIGLLVVANAVLWIVGILVVFVPLAVMRYRRAT